MRVEGVQVPETMLNRLVGVDRASAGQTKHSVHRGDRRPHRLMAGQQQLGGTTSPQSGTPGERDG